MPKNAEMDSHLTTRGETDNYDGIPETLYVAFGTDFIEVTSDRSVVESWGYKTRVFEQTGEMKP